MTSVWPETSTKTPTTSARETWVHRSTWATEDVTQWSTGPTVPLKSIKLHYIPHTHRNQLPKYAQYLVMLKKVPLMQTHMESYPSTRFHGNPSSVFCVVLLTNKQQGWKHKWKIKFIGWLIGKIVGFFQNKIKPTCVSVFIFLNFETMNILWHL